MLRCFEREMTMLILECKLDCFVLIWFSFVARFKLLILNLGNGRMKTSTFYNIFIPKSLPAYHPKVLLISQSHFHEHIRSDAHFTAHDED